MCRRESRPQMVQLNRPARNHRWRPPRSELRRTRTASRNWPDPSRLVSAEGDSSAYYSNCYGIVSFVSSFILFTISRICFMLTINVKCQCQCQWEDLYSPSSEFPNALSANWNVFRKQIHWLSDSVWVWQTVPCSANDADPVSAVVRLSPGSDRRNADAFEWKVTHSSRTESAARPYRPRVT